MKRANQKQIKERRDQYNKARSELRQKQTAQGLRTPSHATISNHKCDYESVEAECHVRNAAVSESIGIFRSKLPILLKQLSKIKDPRNPKKTKHKLTTLMIYGILTFVFQMSSCRQANREMTRPTFWQNLFFFLPGVGRLAPS